MLIQKFGEYALLTKDEKHVILAPRCRHQKETEQIIDGELSIVDILGDDGYELRKSAIAYTECSYHGNRTLSIHFGY